MSDTPLATDASSRLDALLVDFFSIFAQIRSIRAALSSLLSDGFYQLSLARHDSPLLPLDQSSYAGRDMTATTTVRAETVDGGDADTSAVKYSLHQYLPSSSTSASAASSPIRQGVFSAHLSARERRLDALIAQRGQLDDGVEQRIDQSLAAADLAAASLPPPLPELPSTPLHWFGLLAPPPLGAAQAAFEGATARVAELAALHDRLRVLEEQWMSELQQKDAAMAEKRRSAAERWRQDSERKPQADGSEEDSDPSIAPRKYAEESKEQGRSQTSVSGRAVAATQHAAAAGTADLDDEMGSAMQSLSLTKHRAKGS